MVGLGPVPMVSVASFFGLKRLRVAPKLAVSQVY